MVGAVEEFVLLPVLGANQNYVVARLVGLKQAARVQQFLKDLVVGSERDLGIPLELVGPEGEGILQRLSGKRGCNGDLHGYGQLLA